jgi:hypothetical protein
MTTAADFRAMTHEQLAEALLNLEWVAWEFDRLEVAEALAKQYREALTAARAERDRRRA